MGLLNALHAGTRGLAAASAGIDVTTQNVTNVNTPGYSRRTVAQQTSDPVSKAGLFLGHGPDVTGITRITDRLLGTRLIAATGDKAAAESLESALQVIEPYFDEASGTGIVASLDAFFDAISSASTDPSSTSLRLGVVNAAATFATTVSRTAGGIQAAIDGFDTQLGEGLDEVNAQLTEIANLNAKIGRAGTTTGPADLLDRRDELIKGLGATLGATVDLSADGQATVFVGGHAVVSGGEARTLSVLADVSGASQVSVSMDGGTMQVTSELGGEWGGLVEARSSAQGYLDSLDEFATTFSDAVNAQHATGYDANAAAGTDVFTVTASGAAGFSLASALADDPLLLAFAGDSTAAAGDGVNLQALLSIESDSSMFATGTSRTFLSAIASTIGADIAAATANVETQVQLTSDLETARASVSGVDSDEEAMHLLQYQAAYRAAARVVSAADELIGELLMIGR